MYARPPPTADLFIMSFFRCEDKSLVFFFSSCCLFESEVEMVLGHLGLVYGKTSILG